MAAQRTVAGIFCGASVDPPTLIRRGLRTLDEGLFLKVELKAWALCFGVSTVQILRSQNEEISLLLGALLAEGGIHLILFDTGRRVTALIEILLFSAVAHHAGMGNVSFLIGVLRNRGLIRHLKYSSTTTA
jgi:hypothetical protein